MTAYAKGGQMDNIKFGPGTIHMAKHGNKARTRKKNRSRAIRIIERRCNR